MTNLEATSGLPIELTDDLHLKFHKPLKDREPTFVRRLSELQPVLMNKTAKPEPARDEMYYVYRKIALPEDQKLTEKEHLEYDITIIPAGRIGREFNKTVGHYHDDIPGKKIAHPELYEILSGQALFFLQKMDPDYQKVISVIVFEAKAGDKVVYPPNYGHIMVNIGKGPLVTANWLCTDYKPLYEPVAKMGGMAYYVVATKDGYEFVPNPKYQNPPEVRIITQNFMSGFPITGPKPMYTQGILHPKDLEFLTKPQKYAVELSSITS